MGKIKVNDCDLSVPFEEKKNFKRNFILMGGA